MRYRFSANLFSILVAVTAVNPSITHERYCSANTSQSESRLILRISIPFYQIYRKLPH
jgi:hypothetical protein